MAQMTKGVRASVTWDFASGGMDGSPVHLLFLASQGADKIFTHAFGKSGLTPRQYAVLVTVAHNEGLTQVGLASRLRISGTRVANIVRRLVEKGLLSRQRAHDDFRTYSVSLTGAGRQAINITNPIATQVDNEIVAAVPARRRERFVVNLSVMVKSHRAKLCGHS